MQTATSTSTITITATPTSRPGSANGITPGPVDGLTPGSVDSLAPGSVDSMTPGSVHSHIKCTEVGDTITTERFCGPEVIDTVINTVGRLPGFKQYNNYACIVHIYTF